MDPLAAWLNLMLKSAMREEARTVKKLDSNARRV
jgi:hypothetical protein